MRHVKIYSLSLGLGLLSASAGTVATVAGGALTVAGGALVSGCALSCEETYVDCTSKAGLRYVTCGDSHYEFNDGANFDSRGLALDYCYCSTELLLCDYGGVTLCNTTSLPDGGASVIYDNNTSDPLEKGAAACRGWDKCTLVTAGCSNLGWYLSCIDDGETYYVTSNAQVVNREQDARTACIATGEGTCREAVEDCSEVDDCSRSVACYSAVLDDCRTYPLCSDNKDALTCTADPACKWEID